MRALVIVKMALFRGSILVVLVVLFVCSARGEDVGGKCAACPEGSEKVNVIDTIAGLEDFLDKAELLCKQLRDKVSS